MNIENHAPELKRLRRAMRIEWNEYRHWIDHSMPTIAALEWYADLFEEEEMSPLIRAQYIHEMWWTHS